MISHRVLIAYRRQSHSKAAADSAAVFIVTNTTEKQNLVVRNRQPVDSQ